MINIEYANAYSEVLEILKYISKEDYEKIPISKIQLFETNQNKEYIFEYNPSSNLVTLLIILFPTLANLPVPVRGLLSLL